MNANNKNFDGEQHVCHSASVEWVTPEQVSEFTGLSLSRLTNQRCERIVFPFYQIRGTRAVVYDKAEIDSIIAAGKVDVA